jgi:hypothetical protein
MASALDLPIIWMLPTAPVVLGREVEVVDSQRLWKDRVVLLLDRATMALQLWKVVAPTDRAVGQPVGWASLAELSRAWRCRPRRIRPRSYSADFAVPVAGDHDAGDLLPESSVSSLVTSALVSNVTLSRLSSGRGRR